MLATFFAPVEKFNYEFTCFVNIKTSQLMCSANEDDWFLYESICCWSVETELLLKHTFKFLVFLTKQSSLHHFFKCNFDPTSITRLVFVLPFTIMDFVLCIFICFGIVDILTCFLPHWSLSIAPLKISESQKFSYVFMGYRKRPLSWNGLKWLKKDRNFLKLI